jgi:methyl-accepting chemotaxis protein
MTMRTTIATALVSGEAAGAAEELTRQVRAKIGDGEVRLLVAFASTAQPLHEVVEKLGRTFPRTTVIAASTAGEFTEKGDAKSSVSLFALTGDFRVYAGMGVGLKKDPERALAEAIDGLPRELNGYPHRTGLLLLDPLAGNGEETTLMAAQLLGSNVPLAGGAAGDDLKMAATHVAYGTRVATDALVVAQIFSKKPLGLGVCHGHEPLSDRLRITRASGSLVYAVEGRPAWDVWREHTRENARSRGIDVGSLSHDEEGAFLLRYEAGLAVGTSYKIRAPLSRRADGSINFSCGIPEGSIIRITESVPDRQISSAREAARRARSRLAGSPVAGALVFDCICRNLILGDRFKDAVHGISDELGGAPIAGFETYGEIALDAGDMSGFHNTTSVVLAFPS